MKNQNLKIARQMIQSDRDNYRDQKNQLDQILLKNIELNDQRYKLIVATIQSELDRIILKNNLINQAQQEIAMTLLELLEEESSRRSYFENAVHKNLSQVCKILKQDFEDRIKNSQV